MIHTSLTIRSGKKRQSNLS
uniref:Uncharacterized protein n=1 Tax=Rhizophora mucronata TaxID=61149 RepID=A0A2P2N9T1_RHIMU